MAAGVSSGEPSVGHIYRRLNPVGHRQAVSATIFRFPKRRRRLFAVVIALCAVVAVAGWIAKPLVKPMPEVIRHTASSALAASTVPEIFVIDGDTVGLRDGGRDVRLIGLNAPETGIRALCPAEAERGQRATARLRDLIRGGKATVELVRCSCPPGTEGTMACNFGRRCGVLRVNGRDVATTLIAEQLAVPFHCGATSCPPVPRPWC